MQIVAAAYSLAGTGGSETYLVTVADHLQRLGHDVWLHTREPGRSSAAAQRLGLRVADDEGQLPPVPDVLLVQDAVVACDLAARYPATPQAFVAHSDVYDLQLPPQLPDLVATVIVLYDRVERRIRALAEPVGEIVRLAQPVDVERFKPTRPLPERPLIAMTLGNYVHGQRLALLRRACERAGVELRHVGHHGEGERPAEHVINDADIVFGKARVVIEAMACGRAAYVFDHNGGDGWVTPGSYEQLAADNFGGQSLAEPIGEDRIVADLALYEPGMGIVNRDLAVAHHAAEKHAAELVEVLRRVVSVRRAVAGDAPLRELARLVRLYHRADVQAYAIRAETEAFAARAAAAEQRAAELERALAAREQRFRELEREASDFAVARREAAAVANALQEQLVAVRAEAAARAGEAAVCAQEAAALRQQADARATEVAARTEDAAAHAREAARLGGLLSEVTGSRRWRGVQAVMRPADRLRRATGPSEPTGPSAKPAAVFPAPAPVPAPAAPSPTPAPALARAASAPAPAPAPALARGASAPATALAPRTAPSPATALAPRAAPSPAIATAPPPATATAAAPAPFVVGVPRSGTTLLRLQLDSHPDLAIGPETGFGLVARDLGLGGAGPDDLLAAIAALDTWVQLGLDYDEALRALRRATPWSVGAGLRALYTAFAARDGKPRWGDKTPAHVTCMTDLASALPEARFIHLIRDGRDVAVSVRHLPFAPGDGSIEAIACDWRDSIVGARAASGGLAHYREVRYERLVREPEPVLRHLCEFVELEFSETMLRAHERAATALAHIPRRQLVGGVVATREERLARHAQIRHAPDPARIGRWREELTGDEVKRFEAQAGELLGELGYA